MPPLSGGTYLAIATTSSESVDNTPIDTEVEWQEINDTRTLTVYESNNFRFRAQNGKQPSLSAAFPVSSQILGSDTQVYWGYWHPNDYQLFDSGGNDIESDSFHYIASTSGIESASQLISVLDSAYSPFMELKFQYAGGTPVTMNSGTGYILDTSQVTLNIGTSTLSAVIGFNYNGQSVALIGNESMTGFFSNGISLSGTLLSTNDTSGILRGRFAGTTSGLDAMLARLWLNIEDTAYGTTALMFGNWCASPIWITCNSLPDNISSIYWGLAISQNSSMTMRNTDSGYPIFDYYTGYDPDNSQQQWLAGQYYVDDDQQVYFTANYPSTPPTPAMAESVSAAGEAVYWGYWEADSYSLKQKEGDLYENLDTDSLYHYVMSQSGVNSEPGQLPDGTRTFSLIGGSGLLSESSINMLNILNNSSISVDFSQERMDIELELAGDGLAGVLSATEVPLSNFWFQNSISLSGTNDFSIHGGSILGGFVGYKLEAIMSIITARSNLDELFRGSAIWEDVDFDDDEF
jgi:hypothetical protein